MKEVVVFVKNLTSGGAEKQSVLLAKILANDCKVHYVIFNGKKIHDKYLDLLKEDPRVKIKVFDGNYVLRFFAMVQYLKENHIDVIFSYLTMANLLAVAIGKIAKTRKIYTGLRNARLPYLKQLVDKIVCNYVATAAVCNCYSGKKHFISKGFKEDKILVIPNCFDNILPYSPKKQSSVIKIITVGRFVKQKDYETAIACIAGLKDMCPTIMFKFIIVGYGELESQVRQWVNAYKVGSFTEILINPNNIPQLEYDADIYLSTSLFEGTSNSIMEGMNANLPVVGTDVGDNYCLVKEEINGFLCKTGDVHTLSLRLKKLLEANDLRENMGKKSKEILADNFGVDIFLKRYLDLI